MERDCLLVVEEENDKPLSPSKEAVKLLSVFIFIFFSYIYSSFIHISLYEVIYLWSNSLEF